MADDQSTSIQVNKKWPIIRWSIALVFFAGLAWASVRQVPDLQKRMAEEEKATVLFHNEFKHSNQTMSEIKGNQKSMNEKLDKLLLRKP